MIRLLSFSSADRQRLLPCHCLLPAALFLRRWLLPLKAPTFVLGLPDSFTLGSRSLCQGLARKSLLLCELQGWEWQSGGCWVQHRTLLSCSFILQGTSSVEMELKVKLSCFVLAAEPQISSFLSYCLTFCLCLSVTEIEQMVFVCRFLAPSNYWMMIRFWFGACTGTFSVPASFEELCQVVKLCACLSVVPDYYWLCSYSVPSDGCQVNKVWDVLAAFGAYRAFACTQRGRWYLG